MKIVTLNLNGLRSALKKGLAEWVAETAADIYCFQEMKIDPEALEKLGELFPGYQLNFHPAQKKGYSGVAVLSKIAPKEVRMGCGVDWVDHEGRIIEVDFDGFTVLNVYVPSGTMGDARQTVKDDFMAFFLPYIQKRLVERPNLVIVGDFNICHTAIDLYNPDKAQKTSGYLPHERAWFGDFLQIGLVDCFRTLNPAAEKYSWFSFRFDSRSTNRGWRIDYQLVGEALRDKIIACQIDNDRVFSDHCPNELALAL